MALTVLLKTLRVLVEDLGMEFGVSIPVTHDEVKTDVVEREHYLS